MADGLASILVRATTAFAGGALVAGVVAVGVVAVGVVPAGVGTRHAGAGPDAVPRPADASSSPLGTPPVPPAGEGGWTALHEQVDGSPVAWDPCRPVRYVVSGPAPPGLAAVLDAAVADLAAATGLLVVAEGATDERPSRERASVQPQRYGERWAPVLVAWSDPQESPGLAGDVLGYAGPQVVDGTADGARRYVTGTVVLDAPQLAEVVSREAGLARAGAVLRHEMGHLAGLGHVDDRRQLMYPSATPLVVAPGDGDRRGLAALGAGPCFGEG